MKCQDVFQVDVFRRRNNIFIINKVIAMTFINCSLPHEITSNYFRTLLSCDLFSSSHFHFS